MSTPRVVGPITAGRGIELVATAFNLATVGYERQEYFVTGTASSFMSATPLTPDGRWDITTADTAPYTTRVVVHRPQDPATFRGIVIVEWLNVSAGFDTAPDWLSAHNVMIREGAVWIGVSAQAAGVQGGTATVGGIPAAGLTAADPERYGSLHHPGDSFSYDIFSQVGRVARGGASPDPIGGGRVERVIAIGESQSAFRLVTYINGVHPHARAFDGFLVHSRGGNGWALAQEPQAEIPVPPATIIRTDLDVPVLTFQTESDVTDFAFVPARQPDTDRMRLWEVAGTAHADAYTAGIGFTDVGDGAAEVQLLDVGAIDGGPLGCAQPINAGPAYAVLQAAIFGLIRWAAGDPPPPTAPRLELASDDPVTLARDEHGNALGGIRTPFVDVPIATLRGSGNHGDSFCRLFGSTTPFDAATLAALYPGDGDYSSRFERSATEAERAGFLRPEEARNLKRAAQRAAVPGPRTG